jgi:TolB-like protein/class 3 adenylate cyclase
MFVLPFDRQGQAMSETRKLAAILVADVVGYSRLAGSDEDRILARLRSLRSDLIDPTVSVHHGRVVKRTGDGAIIEFRSVVDAVRCAIEVQSGMAERNAGLHKERRIVLRIGIHVGEVVEEADGDLMGDGVNIAARLEGVAEPGGVCLSEDAYRQVKTRLDIKFNDLGPTRLKNIAEPTRIYSLEISQMPIEKRTSIVAQQPSAPPRLSIVVLPFVHLGGNASQDYFADGITESLTTDLSRISGSFVIARNTAFTYKGKAIDAKQVGRELNVRYVLEGSVQRGSDRMRINVQLIEADTGKHLWADRFDKSISDLFEMQDEIVSRLANSLDAQLADAEAKRAERLSNPDSMDFYFRGRAWHNKGANLEYLDLALGCYEKALVLDPENVAALVGTAGAEMLKVGNYLYSENRAHHLARGLSSASRAVAVAAEYAPAQASLASCEIYNKQAARGIARLELALQLDPNLADAHFLIGLGKIFVGRAEDMEAHIHRALRLSPRDTRTWLWLAVVGHSKVHIQEYEAAVTWITRSIHGNGRYSLSRFYLAIALVNLGRLEEARSEVSVGLSLDPTFTIARFRAGRNSDDPNYLRQRDRMYQGMRAAGVPEE